MAREPGSEEQTALNLIPAAFVDFERVSHAGELLIVFFYAEAYEEAVRNGLEMFKHSGEILRPMLLFAVFCAVTVRFFIGNFFHLSDARWKDTWEHGSTRVLYFIDAFFIVLESLSMIVLGSLDVGTATVTQIAAALIMISGLDVVWIVVKWGVRLIFARARAVDLSWAWCWLNLGAVALFGTVMYFFLGQQLYLGALGWIVAINGAAFIWDMILTNKKGPWTLGKKERAVSI